MSKGSNTILHYMKNVISPFEKASDIILKGKKYEENF
jgi:hypothetical protein